MGFRALSQHDTRDVLVTSNTSWIRCTVASAMVARLSKLAVTDGETVEVLPGRRGDRLVSRSNQTLAGERNDHCASSNH